MATPEITPDPNLQTESKPTFRYQPKYPDGHELAGQPMGGEQVVEYDGTADDLGQKMAENNNRLQAELRNVKRQAAVNHPADNEEIPADAQKLSSFHAFQPRVLTPEERLRIAKGMADPERVAEVLDLAIEARLGAKPEQFARLDSVTTKNYFNSQGQEFRRRHPDLPWASVGKELVESLLGWCQKRDLAYTVENLELALDRLQKAGLLPETPIAAEETPGEIAPGAERALPADSGGGRAEPSRRPVVRSSALSSRTSSTPAAPVSQALPTWAEFEKMSVDQIKAKPADWKRRVINTVVRKVPADELNRHMKKPTVIAKIDALG